ncbi:MAG: heavy metal translocating P-type ATPase [Nitrospirota bacterium]
MSVSAQPSSFRRRSRLKLPIITTEPLLAARVESLLRRLPGIGSVAADPVSGCVTITYDRSIWTTEKLRHFLSQNGGPNLPGINGASKAATVPRRTTRRARPIGAVSSDGSARSREAVHRAASHDRSAAASADPSTRATTESQRSAAIGAASGDLGPVTLIHAIKGRLRVRVPRLKSDDRLADRLRFVLEDRPGIIDVQVNQGCASVTLTYDPAAVTPDSVLETVRGLSRRELRDYQGNDSRRTKPATEASQGSGLELLLSTAGIALGFLAESAAAPLVPFLLLGSTLPMLGRAYDAFARKGTLNVDVLDASAAAVLTVQGQLSMALFMVWLVNLGDYIRDATLAQAQDAVKAVLAYRKSPAWVLRENVKVQVMVDQINAGETVVAYPGERIPVDGTVISGKAAVDQQTLTGESSPVEKGEGDPVYAATVVCDGKLYIRAERIGDQTEAAKIVRLVEEAPVQETRIQNYAERWANDLVPYSFMVAGASAVLSGSLQRAASVLIVDYGTGIRIAAPTAVLASMTKAVRHGLLIKGGRYLERLAEVDAVVFDKTGTLTMGAPEVMHVASCGRWSSGEMLVLAAASERRLTHPVAQAVVKAAAARGLDIPERTASKYVIGLGVQAQVDGRIVHVGCRRFMTHHAIEVPREVDADLREWEHRALSPICVAVNGSLAGVLACADPLRPDAEAVVRRLRDLGVKDCIMVTGDHQRVARHVAERVGITRYVAEALPEQKVSVVKDLQAKGRTVAVVGDGINDSPALAHADVGIAVDGGADIARETAQVVLINGGLWKVPVAVEIGREATDLIRRNWSIISLPNTVALGLSVFGLLGPGAATLLSNGSAILATANALRPLLDRVQDRD